MKPSILPCRANGHLRAQRFQLPARCRLKSQFLAHRPDLHRPVRGPYDREDLAVIAGQRGLVEALAAVRDQQDRPSRHPGGLRGGGHGAFRFGPVLLGQPVQDPLGDQFLPLGLDFLLLLGLLLGERVQFASASGDPLQVSHTLHLPRSHRVPLRSRIVGAVPRRAQRNPRTASADRADDLHHGHPPPTGTSTATRPHTSPPHLHVSRCTDLTAAGMTSGPTSCEGRFLE